MKACHTPFPWDLSVAQNTNCAHDGVVMPVCPNSSQCPGICVSHKSGSTAFKLAMQKEFASRGTRLRYYSGCRTIHCSQFPWPAWRAPKRVIRIVRHPETRLLSAYGFTYNANTSYDAYPESYFIRMRALTTSYVALPLYPICSSTRTCAGKVPCAQGHLRYRKSCFGWRSTPLGARGCSRNCGGAPMCYLCHR